MISGLPSYLLLLALGFVVMQSQSRLVALGVCAVLFVWFLVALRQESSSRKSGARKSSAGIEASGGSTPPAANQSDPQQEGVAV